MTEAIEERKPCFLKNMTVIGKLNGGNEPHVYMDVPVGTSVGEMIERSGGIDGLYGEIIMGGPSQEAPPQRTRRLRKQREASSSPLISRIFMGQKLDFLSAPAAAARLA